MTTKVTTLPTKISRPGAALHSLTFEVRLPADVTAALIKYANEQGQEPEIILAEAARAYLTGER